MRTPSTAARRLALIVCACMLMPSARSASGAWFSFHRLIPSPTSSFYCGAAVAAVDDRFLVGDPRAILQTLEGPPPFGAELAATFVIATGGRIVVSSYGNLFVFDPPGNSLLGIGEQYARQSRVATAIRRSRVPRRSECVPAPARGAGRSRDHRSRMSLAAARRSLPWTTNSSSVPRNA